MAELGFGPSVHSYNPFASLPSPDTWSQTTKKTQIIWKDLGTFKKLSQSSRTEVLTLYSAAGNHYNQEGSRERGGRKGARLLHRSSPSRVTWWKVVYQDHRFWGQRDWI